MAFVAALAFRARRAETKKIGGVRPSAERMPPSTKERTSSTFRFVCQEVGLVDDEQDLLPPVADELEVAAFALGQRPLGRGDEQHQVAPRHEAPGELLVVADDRVRPRRIHDGDLPQKLVGISLLEAHRLCAPFSTGSSACLKTVMRSVVGVTPSSAISAPSNALMNADFPELNSPTIDQQEHLLEVGERPPDEPRILRRRAEILEERDQALQKLPLPLYQRLPPLVEYPHSLTPPSACKHYRRRPVS